MSIRWSVALLVLSPLLLWADDRCSESVIRVKQQINISPAEIYSAVEDEITFNPECAGDIVLGALHIYPKRTKEVVERVVYLAVRTAYRQEKAIVTAALDVAPDDKKIIEAAAEKARREILAEKAKLKAGGTVAAFSPDKILDEDLHPEPPTPQESGSVSKVPDVTEPDPPLKKEEPKQSEPEEKLPVEVAAKPIEKRTSPPPTHTFPNAKESAKLWPPLKSGPNQAQRLLQELLSEPIPKPRERRDSDFRIAPRR